MMKQKLKEGEKKQPRLYASIGREKKKTIQAKYKQLSAAMDEQMRRLWAGSEAQAYGRGGIRAVAEATGMSRSTVQKGWQEITGKRSGAGIQRRIRRSGGGRKRMVEQRPGLWNELETLVDPATRGDPMSPLRWTCKSLRQLARELQGRGYGVSPQTVGRLLEEQDYSLQGNRKTREGTNHPDRDAQFHYLAKRVAAFQRQGQPVISVDTKKKELVGNFKNAGREWQPQGQPLPVNLHDFGQNKAVP